MADDATIRLLAAIDYPERPATGAAAVPLLVDGGMIVAEDVGGRLRLVCRLTDDADDLPRLAAYAAGRMLREDAVLAGDAAGAFLWQEAPAGADAHRLRRLFEAFADSCDWWRARVEARRSADASSDSPFSEMIIRP